MHSRNDGYTLVELIVSISLALFVSTLIFSAYTHLFKGIRFQTRQADTVREMFMARKAIGRAFDSLETVTLLSPGRIIFSQAGGHELHTLEYQEGTLYKDSREIAKDLKSFSLSAGERQKDQFGRRVINWECSFGANGWVGGAIIARDSSGTF